MPRQPPPGETSLPSRKGDRGDYWRDERLQARYRQLIAADDGTIVANSEFMEFTGDDAERASAAVEDLAAALEAVSDDIDGLGDALVELPFGLRQSVAGELIASTPSAWPVDRHQLEAFSRHEPGQILLQHWGDDAERRIGVLSHRLGRIVQNGGPDAEEWLVWLAFAGDGGLTSIEAATALDALSR